MFAYTKIMQGIQAVSAAVTDAYFNLVTLLLPGNGTNGAQNNTFLDSSSNNFTITRNGNTTQGTFSPFSQTGWSNYFDGSSYLSVASNTVFGFGTGDLTLEGWFYSSSSSGQYQYIDCRGSSYTNTALCVFQVSGTYGVGIGTTQVITGGSVLANQWVHIAVTRSGTSLKLFVNGTQSGSTYTDSNNYSAFGVNIGNLQGSSGWNYTGYASNVRVTKGGALYTGTFTPSTTPLTTTVSAGTVSLLTCQSNRFIDNSSNAFAITVNGTPSVQAFSPFAPTAAYSAATNGGSGYFDGNGDYLNFTGNSNTSIGSNDWTVEAWIYCTSFSQQYQQILRGQSSNMILLMLETTAKRVQCEIGGGSSAYSPATLQLNTWTHCAAVRSGSNVTVYLNGVGGTAVSMNPTTTTTEAFRIGTDTDLSRWFNGYICGLRMVKGTAVYTADFTPPTAPPTSITNTQLLLNFTNAGITDATAKNVLETVGNAQISTTQSKFGGSSMYFDGTGDYASLPQSILFDLPSDFTVEFWVYFNSVATTSFVGKWGGVNLYAWVVQYVSGTGLRFYSGSSGSLGSGISGSWTPSTGTWYHVAVTRSSGSVRLFVDGTQVGTTTSNADNCTASNPLNIARNQDGDNQYLNGYIDDLRVTKGYARYTANFTPPTAAFPLS